MFGSMYYIVPRLVGREWRYATLIKLHFWGSAYGIGLMILMLLAGGFIQGINTQDPSLPFSESVQAFSPICADAVFPEFSSPRRISFSLSILD